MTRVGTAIALVLSASGCDYLFQIDKVSLARDGRNAGDDAHIEGPPPGMCTDTAVDDSFADPTPCTWGTKFGGQYVTSGGGRLVVSPPSDAYSGGCDAPIGSFVDGGIVAEITKVIGGSPYAFTGIQAFGSFDTSLQVNNGELKFEDPSASNVWEHMPYDPVAMRWLRLRPDRTRDAIVGEYSSDGKAWEVLGYVATTVPATVKPTLIGGVAQGASSFNGVAEFSRFIVCL
jgi:hypothetical protein